MNREDDPHLKDRVRRLMGFLRELVKARSKPVLDIDRHVAGVWLSDDTTEAALVREATAGEVLLRSRRVVLTGSPTSPEALRDFICGDTADSSAIPTLDPAAVGVEEIFQAWLTEWQLWAVTDRERRRALRLYTVLERARQDLGERPESIELVVAAGLLTLPANGAEESVRTHLLTQPVTVERDEATGDLLVRLVDDTSPRLEDTQLLTGRSVFDPSGARLMQEELQALASPLDDGVPVFLKAWAARTLTVPVGVEGDGQAGESAGCSLTASPALVLRHRGAFALVEYYDRMIREVEREETSVPLGLAQLVEAIEPRDRLAWLDRTGAAGSATLADDPLFPLPANPEQREIIERLTRDSGVVVEGPPGTGKTHTIANLVSALLAQGQRVLVTSEKSQALRVLRDKLPAEMQELCVAITDIGRGGSDELNRSVAEIATRKSSHNEAAAVTRIEDLSARRDAALGRRNALTEQIRSLREAETFVHPEIAPGYAGTEATIVRGVIGREARFDWMPGPLITTGPPIDADQMTILVELTDRSTPTRAERTRQTFPMLDSVMPPYSEMIQLCRRAAMRPQAARPEAEWLLDALADAAPDVLLDVGRRCDSLRRAVADIRRESPEMQAAADSVLMGVAGHLWTKTAEIAVLRQTAVRADALVGPRVVEVPAVGRPVLDAYDAMARAMHSGVEWRGRFRKSSQQRSVEAFGAVATVDGVAATTSDAIGVVVEHLRALDCVQRAETILADLGVRLTVAGSRAAQVNELDRAARSVGVVNVLLEQTFSITDALRSRYSSAPSIRSVAEAAALADVASSIAVKVDSEMARTALAEIGDSVTVCFAAAPSPESTALVGAIRAGDGAGIASALEALDEARTVKSEELRLASLRQQLEGAAPELAALIADSASDGRWSERIADWDDAWAWRRAAQWLDSQHEDGLDRRLESDLDAVESEIAKLTTRLAAERAWLSCLDRMTAEQVQALQAYRGQVANIGKGTGRYAEQYRAAARSAMQVAQGAVPAWVMPLQQVLASIPAEPGAFDVVIVDEASQADIASLFLLWLAPRVIVVGDDKQCAPSEVASGALDGVFARLDTYLPDMPEYLRASLTPRDSLFSMLRTRFGQVVRLREHFRCMPEIINWSSNQFYRDSPLVPLRQFGSDRLPPLRSTYVEGGVNKGQDARLINEPEALAIADAVEACLVDPAYDDKTFGVVVLQGQGQVDRIRDELTQRLDARQWDERRLRIGTPPDFQGDERHVVLLSMVIAPGRRSAARTDNRAQRAFNVAASRAMDQLWLFHSVTPDALRGMDLRHSLLTYMQSTSSASADPLPEGVTRDDRHPDFDSLFEQRVFLDLVARGYHVNPQVEVNSRRIDLVVTGTAGKLAVECDGDAFHATPEQRARDLERERELKRCGWEFWRVRESAYYRDPVSALSTLWTELDRRGITPLLVDETGEAESKAWTPAELIDDESRNDPPDVGSIPESPSAGVPEPGLPDVGLPVTSVPASPVPASPVPAPAVPAVSVPMPPVTASPAPAPAPTAPESDVGPSHAVLPRGQLDEGVSETAALPSIARNEVLDTGAVVDTGGAIADPTVDAPGPAWEVMSREAIPGDDEGLRSRVLEAATAGAVIITDLANEWGMDRWVVHTVIKGLIADGLMVKVGAKRGTRYERVTVDPVPRADREEDRVDVTPRLLRQLVTAEAKRGAIGLADLERRLPSDSEQLSRVVDELVEAGTLVAVGDAFAVAGDPVAARGSAIVENGPEQKPEPTPRGPEPPTTSESNSLPPANPDTAKRLLVAASWGAPITWERATSITRLEPSTLTSVLVELESEQLLRKERTDDGIRWVR
ncbi:AAA domain-containing protein [Gordonia sp. (in: high G+C Gram-positive bacteria)]|uniref:AAA domain-containing protein n=1 Tax=Gordonia sp. (in: high G+C Gram-positive bacteria) TaxID=84139 RepID=UPI003C72B090